MANDEDQKQVTCLSRHLLLLFPVLLHVRRTRHYCLACILFCTSLFIHLLTSKGAPTWAIIAWQLISRQLVSMDKSRAISGARSTHQEQFQYNAGIVSAILLPIASLCLQSQPGFPKLLLSARYGVAVSLKKYFMLLLP